MRSAALVQLGCVCLHPAPNATGVHLHATFGYQLGDVLVGERIPQVPAHAQDDHFSWEMAPFERMVRVDRHGLLPYQDAGAEVRNGTFQATTMSLPSAYFTDYGPGFMYLRQVGTGITYCDGFPRFAKQLTRLTFRHQTGLR